MNLPPVTLEHGERFSKLKVLRKKKNDHRWMVGCDCGARFPVSANKLMRGIVKACLRCTRPL